MEDDTRRGRSEDQRRLRTPRSRSRSRSALRRRDRSVDVVSRGDRRLSLQEREAELERGRQQLLALEREVLRDRERISRARISHTREQNATSTNRNQSRSSEQRHRRSRTASPPRLRERSCSAATHRSRGHYEQPRPDEHREDRVSSNKRSRTPSFSIKDVADIINSIKTGLSSQSLTPGALKNIGHKNILPEFDPSGKNQRVDIWLRKVNECASVYGWDEKTTIHFTMQKLQGLAKVWYEGLNTILFPWSEWQEKLKSAFPYEQNYGQTLENMLRRKSKFGEPIENYYYEKLALVNQCDITGKRAVDCIIHGITDRTMKSSALALCCSQPDQLLQFLMSNKEVPMSERSYTKNKNWADSNHNVQTNPKVNSNKNNRSQVPVVCFNCRETGHPYMRCPKQLIKCNKCNKIGHKAENCHVKPEGSGSNANSSKTMAISTSCPNLKYIKIIKVNNLQTEAFIDFGSEVTLVKRSLISKLGVAHDQVTSVMKGFGNSTVRSLGTLTLDLEVDEVSARVLCRVVEDEFLDKPILIGQTFTEQPHILVLKDYQTLRLQQIDTELPAPDPDCDSHAHIKAVKVANDIELFGPASIRARVNSGFNGCVMMNNNVIGCPVREAIVSGGVYHVRNGRLDIPILPCTPGYKLLKDCVIGRGETVEFVRRLVIESPGINEVGSPSVDKHVNILKEDVRLGDLAEGDDMLRLMTILQKYKHCFASGLQDLGCTDLTQMNIELSSQRPIVYRPYRLSHHERDKVQSMIGEMLEAGIVRESVSEYASPIILVRKKDGSSRMCVDYRMLNAATVKERYPMPIIEDEIARLSGQACFITLDLASGYYQVPISEHCKYLTAFVTPDGLYEFNRMPFGLANAPAVFQRLINKVLGSARFSKATAYMDDVLIFGKNAAECLDRLEEVLGLLEKANLTLNLSKCNFLRSSVDYLGYEIGAAGIRPGKTKIQSVLNFPQPTNFHCVRQFLGLASYFRKFIQNFAQIASPLTELLKKDATWKWTSRQEEAFHVLKSKLVDRPILAIYDRDAETELHTDASKEGVGGMLLQRCKMSGSFCPVAYFSRRTSPEEKYYHSYELETLAVIRALEKFRVYLLGKEFKIVTDCSALRSTFVKRDLIPRVARWWLLLQEFNCTIEYRPGVKMAHVDALSRNPNSEEGGGSGSNPHAQVMVINDDDWLHTLQLGDSELNRIKDILQNDMDPKELQYIKDNYVVRDNKLFRCLKGDKNNLRWAVPKGARWQICRLNHDDIGHLGLEKTLERVRKSYWFPKLSRFVKKYVSACIDCAYTKKTVTSNEGLLHPITKIELPFHTLHIDHLGPFVKSKRGNSYLIVVVDAFTKFVFVRPVRNTNTQNVVRVLDDIFFTFRVPDRLISDRGSCYTSQAFRKYCYDKGIKHVLNAVASPQSNGQVERYNRTILNSLKAQSLRIDEKDWDKELGKIQWGLNNTIQKTTGRRPAEVMFGTHMNGEINPSLNPILDETREEIDVSDIRTQVKERIDSEQIRQKEQYDKNRHPARIYNEGDLVKVTKSKPVDEMDVDFSLEN